jgi:16S rRNA (guanine(966)-N(2))-methyltransferase RsmD
VAKRQRKGPEVRIIGGKWKGRALEVPPRARPTSSRAREALFDLLAGRIAGARILDLYAGSGALGLEALSRGAASAVLVETDTERLERNRERLGASEREARILRRPAAAALAELERAGERFDLVFADPPYVLPVEAELGEQISAVLAPGGVFVLQRDRRSEPPALARLAAGQRRPYGRNVFWFFEPL